MLLTRSPLTQKRNKFLPGCVRLACIRHAASVRPEPGSNSHERICLYRLIVKTSLLLYTGQLLSNLRSVVSVPVGQTLHKFGVCLCSVFNELVTWTGSGSLWQLLNIIIRCWWMSTLILKECFSCLWNQSIQGRAIGLPLTRSLSYHVNPVGVNSFFKEVFSSGELGVIECVASWRQELLYHVAR